MLQQFLSRLSSSQKSRIRGWVQFSRAELIRKFRSYGVAELKNSLARMGIRPGDTLLVHSAYGPLLGFQGSPSALIDGFLEVVGTEGNLLMVSMPYFSSTSEYLQKNKVFNVRSTPSKMGLVSETFRRRPEVHRSLHPTHPILAQGAQAESIIAGHEGCLYPCGPGSPFENLLKLDGKVLFFGVTEFHFTFHHYLEHLVREELPFSIYEETPYVSEVIDKHGGSHSVTTYSFTKEAIRRRRVNILFRELARRGQMTKGKIGNTSMVLLKAADSVACTLDLARSGTYFYDLVKDA